MRFSCAMMAASMCLMTSTAFAGDVVNFMHTQPTKQDLIKALHVKGKTRGLQPSTNTDAPSVDLTINFEFDSVDLTKDAMVTLETVANALDSAELKGQNFLIEGHTDAVGSDFYNDILSERRAVAVSSYLITQQDVSADRLTPAGKGEHELLLPETPSAAQNRRVRVKVIMD